MIEKLPQSKTIRTPDGIPVVVTHRAWGHTHQPWILPTQGAKLLSYSVLGIIDKELGFRPVAGTEEYAPIAGDDYAHMMAPTRTGKRADVFRKDDVIAAHKKIVARAAAERAKEQKTAAQQHFSKVATSRRGKRK